MAATLVAAATPPGPRPERGKTVDKKWLLLGLAFVAGVALAGKVRTLPLGNKIPAL